MGFSSKKSYSISISIPSQNDCKKLTVSEHELIHNIKQKIIKEYGSSDGFNNLNNNGLLIVSKKKDIRRFLDEKDEIGDLRRFASDYRLEFVPKRKISSKEEERKNSSVNNTDMQKRFIEIIKSNNDNQVKDILDIGVDPNFLSENGESPLSLCIFNNKVDLINLLLDNGAYIDYKIPNRDKWISYLQYAILCQSFESFKLLIDRGIWIEETDEMNRTALYYAIKKKNIEYVSYLLKKGANVHCVDSKGLIPLHYACKKGDEKSVLYLIDYGSDMNFVDSNGNTPLHIAMKYNYKECVKCLLKRGSRKNLPNNEGQKPVDINRSNNYDEETIKLVKDFDCSTMIPPPPSFDLLSPEDLENFEKVKDKIKGDKDKEKKKKKKSIIVKYPPPPPTLHPPPKTVPNIPEINNNKHISNLNRNISSSSPSLYNDTSVKPFKSNLEKVQSNKNVMTTLSGQPICEPNSRDSLRSNSKVQIVPNIYDSSIYTPNSESSIPTPLTRSTELSPKTAVNPEDQTSPSIETPRTANNNNMEGSTLSLDIQGGENIISDSTNSLTNVNNNNNDNNNNNNNTNEKIANIGTDSANNINITDITNHFSNTNEDDIAHTSVEGSTSNIASGNESVASSTKNIEEETKKFIRHVPKIETTKIILKNLVLSNPNLSTLTESPRSAIYVPSPRKPSRLIKNTNFSSASSLLNAFIRNDTSTILDNILNIDNEKDEEYTNNSLKDIDKDIDINEYPYSDESRSEDNPNLELIKKEFNKELLDYLKNLNVINEGKIITVDPEKYKKFQRNRLNIDEKDYQNTSINNKELLLETYEKLYLILADIHSRSKKAKEDIEKIKEEHNTLIEEIKIIREKELRKKEASGNLKHNHTVFINESTDE